MKDGVFTDRLVRAMGVGLWLATASCSGSSPSPTQPVPAPSVPLPQPSPSPSVTPSPDPSPAAASCPLGKGDVDSHCFTTGAPRLLTDVEAAIDRLVKEQPALFNLNESLSAGAYRVLDGAAYQAGVVKNLQAAGFCAAILGEELQVKSSRDFSEEYDIITSTGFIRRGPGAFEKWCSPANFPLEAIDVIARVGIYPFGIGCNTDRPLPSLDRKEVPVDCALMVTATPKDKNLDDVDPRIHGPEVKWSIAHGEGNIRLEDIHEQPFNMKIVGREPGEFGVCAEVKTIVGCLNGKVIP